MIRYTRTGEHRPPRTGEWFERDSFGREPCQADCDLVVYYWILTRSDSEEPALRVDDYNGYVAALRAGATTMTHAGAHELFQEKVNALSDERDKLAARVKELESAEPVLTLKDSRYVSATAFYELGEENEKLRARLESVRKVAERYRVDSQELGHMGHALRFGELAALARGDALDGGKP